MAGNTVYVQGSYVDVHDNEVVNLSIDGAGEVQVDDHVRPEGATQDDAEAEPSPLTDVQRRIRRAMETLRSEEVLRHAYDYAWVMLVMNQTEDLPTFDHAASFLQYLRLLGLDEGLTSTDTIIKKVSQTRQAFPHWTFRDTTDATEALRRNNVARRFLHCFRTLPAEP